MSNACLVADRITCITTARLIVNVEYAQFPCGHRRPPGWPQAPPGWNVPRDTVVAIGVSLGKHTVPLNSLPYELTKFQKVRGDHDRPQHFYYSDDAGGFAIRSSHMIRITTL
jgi:hypothetical protein